MVRWTYLKSAVVTAAVAILAQTATRAADSEAVPVTVYVGANILDVHTGALRRGLNIVVRAEKIEALVPAESPTAKPPGAEVINVGGLFAVPGLIDIHQHVAIGQKRRTSEAYLRRELFSGVTAVRDMAGDARILASLTRDARLGEIPAPDIHYSALLAGSDFFADSRMADSAQGEKPGAVPWMQTITPQTDIALAIAQARGTGASGLKVYANLPVDLFRSIATEARRQGIPVWAHAAIFPASPKEVADAGPATVSHVCMLAYQTLNPAPISYHNRAPLDESLFAGAKINPALADVFQAMRARGVILDATVWVYHEIERLRAIIPRNPPPTYCSSGLAERLTKQAYEAGVTIATGTDAPAQATSDYPSVFDEMDLLRKRAGMRPLDVIRAATVNAAKAIGAEHEMGVIAPRMLANMAFLSQNPLDEATRLRSVILTVKRGERYWRKDYRPISTDEIDE